MSFFDDNQNVGLILILAGIVCAVMGLISMILVLTSAYGWAIGFAIITLGSLISGIILFLFGMNVRNETSGSLIPGLEFIVGINSFDKVGVFSAFVRALGFSQLIAGILMLIGGLMIPYYGIAGAIISLILAVFFIWAAPQIQGESKGIDKKIIWIILLVLFVLGLLGSLLSLTALGAGSWYVVLALGSVIMILVYLYAVLTCLSPEVKANMDA
jgi:hypothetical protein